MAVREIGETRAKNNINRKFFKRSKNVLWLKRFEKHTESLCFSNLFNQRTFLLLLKCLILVTALFLLIERLKTSLFITLVLYN